ncbi:SpoIIE family protein phosphatase [Sorangium sp. So ce131]|uniref:SpoIIE family protein phosphatase n=1 Tax=Sorangium sp. So ce131 TaxID=3133282 RepID=UPI003F63AB0E
MTTRRPTIGFVIDNVVGDYQSELRAGIERAAEARDVNVLTAFGAVLTAADTAESARSSFYHLLGAGTVDGIIVASSTLCHYPGVDGMRAFCRSFAPLPISSIGMAMDGIPSLMIDNGLGIEIAVGHLVDDHARRRVAYISGPAANEEARLRADAYRRALAERSVPFDDRRFVYGAFTIPSGRAAMRELLARGVDFDAVIAANDRMALGAIEVLTARGLRIPRDVLVCGFDDVGIARFTKPSLTTIRQPISRLGVAAVDAILRMIDGEPVPPLTHVQVELTLRESCGCGHHSVSTLVPPPAADSRSGAPALAEERASLERALKRAVMVPPGALDGWAMELLLSLEEELAGEPGRFLQVLQGLLDAARRQGVVLDQFQAAISLLRSRLCHPQEHGGDPAANEALEQLWHASRILIGREAVHAEGEQRLNVELAAIEVSYGARGFSACLSLPVLKRLLASELPRMQFFRVAVSLYDDAHRATLKPFFLMEDGREVEAPSASFPAHLLAPPGFWGARKRRSMVALPVAFGEVEQFGIAVLDSGATGMNYDVLRLQLGSALKAAALHREVVREVELRERLEQEKVRQESRVAARIQTTLVPRQLAIEGLELCAVMKPAAEVGGDYYDVIARPGGGWLGIGDVAGHGLAAGLIMLMIQSMISALVGSELTDSPSKILSVLNRAVYKNVRDRLERDEHATLLLLRYERSGRVTFAGAHDDMIVCSSRTGRCATIPSTGVWIGALPAIDAMTRDAEFVLEDGDVLVLYSDGVTEARNAHHEQFGLERLCRAIEAVQAAPVSVIRDRILGEVEGWCPSPDDDITIVVARYRAPG